MSETIRKWTLTASVAVFAIAALLAAVHLFVPEARAQEPAPARTAVCESWSLASPGKMENWMNEQLRSGKTDFITNSPAMMCAW